MADHARAVGARAYMGQGYHGHDSAAVKRMYRDRFDPEASLASYRKQLDASIWSNLVERTGLRQMMDRTEKEAFDRSLAEDVPEVTEDNLRATFQRLCADADLIFARGLARAFIDLDERFKSHDAFRLGTRMILTYVFDDWGHWSYSSRKRETIVDVERVFATLDGEAPNGYGLLEQIDRDRGRGMDPRQSETTSRYFRIRGFKNGNAHLWFTRDDLVEKANRVLADYYGEVLPDAVDPDDAEPDMFRTGRAVSKDLQFYPTPDAAADELLHELALDGKRILEPSAGEGGICRAIARRIADHHRAEQERWRLWDESRGKPKPQPARASITAVEVHPDRCDVLRQRTGAFGGHLPVSVVEANFLTWAPAARFDVILMNPPFYGTHWIKHVRHAFGLLADGGVLRAILPVTARLGDSKAHLEFRRWAEKHGRRYGRQWRDLPAESFAASGTRINTTILELWK